MNQGLVLLANPVINFSPDLLRVKVCLALKLLMLWLLWLLRAKMRKYLSVLDAIRPKKPGFLANLPVRRCLFVKKPGFLMPMRKCCLCWTRTIARLLTQVVKTAKVFCRKSCLINREIVRVKLRCPVQPHKLFNIQIAKSQKLQSAVPLPPQAL